jgi:hypothetical protein
MPPYFRWSKGMSVTEPWTMGMSRPSAERASAMAVSEISIPVTDMPRSRKGLAFLP